MSDTRPWEELAWTFKPAPHSGYGRRPGRARRATARRRRKDIRPRRVRHELGPELLDVAGNGDRRRLAERAQALAVDPVAHVEEKVELGLLRLARLEPAQDLRHPARALPARRALAARLVLVELRDADAELHHAAAVVERDDPGRSHCRVQLEKRVEVVADVDLIALQDHCRRAAGNDCFELAAVRNAAAEAVDQLAHARAVLDLVVPGLLDMS